MMPCMPFYDLPLLSKNLTCPPPHTVRLPSSSSSAPPAKSSTARPISCSWTFLVPPKFLKIISNFEINTFLAKFLCRPYKTPKDESLTLELLRLKYAQSWGFRSVPTNWELYLKETLTNWKVSRGWPPRCLFNMSSRQADGSGCARRTQAGR